MKLASNLGTLFMKLFRFSLVGISGTVVNVIVFNTLIYISYIHVNYLLANMIAFCIAATNNFYWNHIWTFKGYETEKSIRVKYIHFFAISGCNLLLNMSVIYILVDYVGAYHSLANILAIGFCFIFNFIGNYLITFRCDSVQK